MLQHVTVQDRMDAAQIVMDVMGPMKRPPGTFRLTTSSSTPLTI